MSGITLRQAHARIDACAGLDDLRYLCCDWTGDDDIVDGLSLSRAREELHRYVRQCTLIGETGEDARTWLTGP